MDSSKYHLNTVYMKPSQQLASGPYEHLRSQLSQQNYFNPRYVDKSPQTNMQQTIGELKKLMAGQESIDQSKLAHIHSIKLHPIINENFISTFDEKQYKLDPKDKVKIVKQKVFRIQNYYNYLYELQSDKQHKRIQQQSENILHKAKRDLQPNSPKSKHSHQRNLKKTDSILDNFDPIPDDDMRLAPQYSKYQPKHIEGQKYFLKEKDRKQVQLSIHKRF